MSIAARELGKCYGEKEAVSSVSFTVAPGEIFGLIGPNGAGKTTTLRILAGLLRPSTGSAEICGFDVVAQPEQAKGSTGFLTGATGLYARLSPREILAFFGQLYGLTADQARERTELLGRLLHFDHVLDRRCGTLSTGERQRVSLARATIHDPPVLILDEPTAGLDVLASRFVADFIRGVQRRGRAILFSTHYLTEAELLCDRVALIHAGRLLCHGTPGELRDKSGARTLEEAFLLLVGDPSVSTGEVS